jgi:hypothetical protein
MKCPNQGVDKSAALDPEGAAHRGFRRAAFERRDDGRHLSASIATGRPPRRRAAARPARTRSWVNDCSNCASAPKTWNRNLPCGVVVSICSVSERNATPRSFSSFTVASRWDSDRPRRSSFQTTRQSPGLRKASAFARPVRSSRLPLARSSNRCRSSTPAASRVSRCKSRAWRSALVAAPPAGCVNAAPGGKWAELARLAAPNAPGDNAGCDARSDQPPKSCPGARHRRRA